MEKEELEALFCAKIGLEIEGFKQKMLKQNPETVFERAYQIDIMISIYELMLEISQELEKEALKKLLVFPNLLAFLYDRWLRKGDSHTEELQSAIKETIFELQETNKRRKKQEGEKKTA